MGIYVEIFIRAAMEQLWQKTQEPSIHQRWDLRFSEIEYLPRASGEPQRFLYATRVGFGLRIEGAGESTGEHDSRSGQRSSALKFWSEDQKSLIESGSGYWKYIPAEDGIIFLTRYDYQTRFGVLGRTIDRLAFGPLLGWATAWSFDRLRLWIEKGVLPESSRTFSLVYTLARITLAFIWIYQGIVPKLIFHSSDEIRMLSDGGVSLACLPTALSVFGWAELCFGVLLVILWRQSWPLWVTIGAMILAFLSVGLRSSQFLATAFNLATLNVAVIALAAIGLSLVRQIPTASHCRRRPQNNNL
jgi:hypothetical protein